MSTPRVNRILVPYDFSPCCKSALSYAVDMATLCDATLTLLHIQAVPDAPKKSWAGKNAATAQTYAVYQQKLVERRHETLSRLNRDIMRFKENGMSILVELHDGIPHETILAIAEQGAYDLIVMGTHGRTGWKHMLIGSTAERVIREAKCPVLTIRRADEDTNP